VLATEQEFWNGRSSDQEEDAHEDIPDIRGRGCLRLSSRTVFMCTWLTKTAQ
jgi:hypothetical protein